MKEENDSDLAYEVERDTNSEELYNLTKEIIEKARKMMYYKGCDDRIGKDIINNTLRLLNLKCEIENINHFKFIECSKKGDLNGKTNILE